jgi:hypothetical protein
MEDTPYSYKVRKELIEFNQDQVKVDKFWKKYSEFLEVNPQALFDYGVYLSVVKNNNFAGMKMVSDSKDKMEKLMKSKFQLENLNTGLNLSENSKPMAYLAKMRNKILIIDCNSAFCQKMRESKSMLKNSDLYQYIPKMLDTQFKKHIKTAMSTNDVLDFDFPLLQSKEFLYEYKISLKVSFLARITPNAFIRKSKNCKTEQYLQ